VWAANAIMKSHEKGREVYGLGSLCHARMPGAGGPVCLARPCSVRAQRTRQPAASCLRQTQRLRASLCTTETFDQSGKRVVSIPAGPVPARGPLMSAAA
jgi:hypothetical protein